MEKIKLKYKLLIFDMDGTILNSLEDLKNACNYALKKNGLPERSLEEVRAFVGNGLGRLATLAIPNDDNVIHHDLLQKEVLADLKAYYAVHNQDMTRPYDGICELLNTLKNKGYKLAVVSNKIDSAVGVLCKKYFPDMFDFYIGDKPEFKRKPEPDMVYEAMKYFGAEKEETLYIGDSEVDFNTAKNAGLDCIAVTWGFRDRGVAIEHGMKIIVDTPNEILDTVESQQ